MTQGLVVLVAWLEFGVLLALLAWCTLARGHPSADFGDEGDTPGSASSPKSE